MISVGQALTPIEIVARTCDSLALAIETLTNASRRVLPRAEAMRLDALSAALKASAQGIRLGQIDSSTARSTIQTSLAVALDSLGGVGMGALFGALGAWATTFVPNPLLKTLGVAGFGVIGLAADWYISDTGTDNYIASQLTDGIFNGAEAISNEIHSLIKKFYDFLEKMPGAPVLPDEFTFQLRVDDAGDTGSGSGTRVTLYHDGLAEQLSASSAGIVVLPNQWANNSGDPKTPWNDPEPI